MRHIVTTAIFLAMTATAMAQASPPATPEQLKAALQVLQTEKNAAEQQAMQALSSLDGASAKIESLTKERDDLKAKYEAKTSIPSPAPSK